MILSVANTKGGVGKTTIAVQLAIARAITGSEVWLVDGDRQGTAAATIAARFDSGVKPGVAFSQYADGVQLRSQIQQQKHKWDDIIIDVGGRDSGTLRASLLLADTVLIPFAPRSYDIWAFDDMVSLIDEVNSIRDGLRVLAVMNQADPADKSADNTEAASIAAGISQFTYLDSPIRRRKAFSNAGGAGLSILEISPKDHKACLELTTLVESIFIVK